MFDASYVFTILALGNWDGPILPAFIR